MRWLGRGVRRGEGRGEGEGRGVLPEETHAEETGAVVPRGAEMGWRRRDENYYDK